MDEVVLVGFWTSPYVMRVKIALLEKGVEYVSPSSFLSTLMRFGRSKKNSSSLMILTTEPEPADCGWRLWASKGEDQEAAKKEFVECLKLLENELGDKPYFAGDYFGLLDIALLPITCRFYTYETFCKFSVEKECPRFMAWVKRCNQRESVSKTLPDPYKVYDFALETKKRFNIE
ncbi:hypothetical protein JHK87_021567 [Glycine soja]|nr:hypothetical protein JHK87_021567 [Glycine soja]